jgi:hypothetical protein
VRATVLGFAVTGLIVLFFSPSWVSFAAWRAMPQQYGDLVAVRRAVVVEQQIADPTTEIRDPIHTTVRCRLLFPTLGHLLHMPPGGTAALAAWLPASALVAHPVRAPCRSLAADDGSR